MAEAESAPGSCLTPLLLQDFHLIDLLAHFDRERIPERVVHAKGAGAYGEFELTHDVSDITSIDMLNGIGKKTPVLTRFSTVGGEKGSADSARDPREGNWDWVFNNTPIFFLRDPGNFPVFIHTQKRNPQTNLKDATMFWDYLSTHQESVHQLMHLFSDRGTPYSFRHMNGYSGHTFKFTKPDGSFVYVQIHLQTDQGNRTLTNSEATHGSFPSWTVSLQVLTPSDAETFRWNIHDLTKVWPHSAAPLRPLGKLTLNRNPDNYFAEIEQAAFSPSHMVPGVEPSADPVLQGRLFSYPDAQRHRLGTNYSQIPVNAARSPVWNPFQRHGATATGKAVSAVFGEVVDEDYVQPRALWGVLGRTEGQQDNFVHNVAVHLSGARVETRERMYGMFGRVDEGLGRRIRDETEREVEKARK
ncbi:catalase-like domain-containing protein [Lasiosphaeria hispida]|uniref:Catalase n=1 Tax=Lasiosphaeria hispida TaxID=260671 RepID=A0AAJ0MFQ6_9PEZI|nr:catalase-like domain-containing protein [Lasiosphaeria hispida]